MPVALRYLGYRFYFYSNEGSRREPIHIHVRKAERHAKFWIDPEAAVAESYRMNAPELNRLRRVVNQNRELIRRSWHEHFGE